MNNLKPTILIIIGISGDLSRRKLLPALSEIAKNAKLPEKFRIVGVTRKNFLSKEELFKNISDKEFIENNVDIFKMDLDKSESYKNLKKFIFDVEKKYKMEDSQHLFYLSVPPLASMPIIEFLGKSGISKNPKVKLLLEKPFGVDFDSAYSMLFNINKYFDENQVYRIDHYLAKETIQNLLVFREGNSLFKKTWNKDFIDRVEVNVSESIGIEGRANFYEQTGALKDLVQSHLLGILSLVLINLPKKYKLSEIQNLRYKALKGLKVLSKDRKLCAVRGQYEGYKEEVGNEKSNTETFASLDLISNNKNWKGVSISLYTGKALDKKCTEIKIFYKKIHEHESNELLFRLEPNESVSFSVLTKRPGYDHEVSRQELEFNFKNYYNSLPKAYEQVIYSAILGDHKFFTLGKEVLETWRIIRKVQNLWAKDNKDLIIYKKGSRIEEIKR